MFNGSYCITHTIFYHLDNSRLDYPPNYEDAVNMEKCPEYEDVIAPKSIFIISSNAPTVE